MKTLLVRYTPRGQRSFSGRLLDTFRKTIVGSEIEELDLCVDQPQLFTVESTEVYWQRNMMGQALSPERNAVLATMDRMTAQLKSADVVAVAFPMFNFSVPAVVKAWFDSILQVGQTIDPSGGVYRGLMTGRRALVLVAAGGIYSEGDGIGPHFGPTWEHAVSLASLEFRFIGYSDVRGVLAEGMAGRDQAAIDDNLRKAVGQVQAIGNEWFAQTA